jgi:uncharacterized protein YbaP (TraB family)
VSHQLKILLSAGLALFGAAACAHHESAPVAAAEPALFVLRDADSTLYLYGTVHLLPPEMKWGGPAAEAALNEADEIWTEIEISPESDAALQPLTIQLGFAPPDQPLSSLLSADEQERLAQLSARLGLPGEVLDRMQPWFAAITLSLMPMLQAGYDPQSGVDRVIDRLGEAAGKRMRAFETGEQQLLFMAGLSEQAQHEMLLDAIEDAEAGPAMLADLTNAWSRGELGALEQLIVRDVHDEYPELFDVLFRQRNLAWAEMLSAEMDGAGVDFVAVGAGHLVGEEGLVELMRARGYDVERVGAAN